MLLNEHHGKRLLARAGIPVPEGLILTPDAVASVRPSFPPPWILKAQVLTGGRGKAGGVVRVRNPENLSMRAEAMFQLTVRGHGVPLVRLEPEVGVAREMYLSLAVARERRSLVLTVGRRGGVEVEAMGRANLLAQDLCPRLGPAPHQVRAAFFHLGLDPGLFQEFSALLANLFGAVRGNGLLLAEINPLALTAAGGLLALDGKVEIDDNVAELTPALDEYFQPEHFTAEENAARAAGLSFVRLDGRVGILVNGAGLAMATMDLLNFSGLPAANFLDLGGGADQARMEAAFSLLFGDAQARVIFVNLFGGILSCERVALAMREALGGRPPAKPLVARLAGNGAEAGLTVFKSMGCADIHLARDPAEALRLLAVLAPGASGPGLAQTLEAELGVAREAVAVMRARKRPVSGEPEPFPIGRDTPILVQGLTGSVGRLHAQYMLDYGARVVAGVTPFKGGQRVLGLPVYDSVRQALREHDIQVSVVFVPPRLAADAVLEAAEAGIPWVVCITEGIPQQDMLAAVRALRGTRTRLIGPNTPGIIVPGQTKIGILPAGPFIPGPVAVLSRSGTLTYEAAHFLSRAGIGQSVCVGVGGDPFTGLGFADMFRMLRHHDQTRAVLVLGEIGGRAEEELAAYVARSRFPKPVFAFIAGRTAPPGRRLGHAGAILEEGSGMDRKLAALRRAGIAVCPDIASLPELVAEGLRV